MPYLNLDPDYINHPKTVRLVGILGHGAEIYPILLWSYCAKFHMLDGFLKGYLKEEVESALKWHGEPGKLVDAMVKVGFLDVRENFYAAHEWKEHEGHLVAYRKRAKRANAVRWNKIPSSPTRIPEGIQNDTPRSPPTKPSKRTKPSKPALPERKEQVLKTLKESPTQVGQPSAEASSKPEAIEAKVVQDHQRVVDMFLKLKGVDQSDKKQVEAMYKRHCRTAVALIKEAGGVETALLAMGWAAVTFDKKQLSWTLETVAKHLPNFYRHGKEDLIGAKYNLTPNQVENLKRNAEWMAKNADPTEENVT